MKQPTVALVPLPPPAPAGVGALARRPDLAADVHEYAAAAQAPATHAARASDWRLFEAWCREHGAAPLPATVETALAYVSDKIKTHALASVERYAATISKVHKLGGHPSPTADPRFAEIMRGIRRTRGVRQAQKEALTPDDLRRALAVPRATPAQTARDRALLLLGLASALRRAELCAIDVEHLAWKPHGVEITVPRSKTDQEGAGRTVAVPRLRAAPDLCPVRALRAWLDLAGITAGPVFRGVTAGGKPRAGRLSRYHVGQVVKHAAAAAGLDPAAYGGHSMRAGYVTLARLQGTPWATIMEQTGHRKLETVKRYARRALDPFKASGVAGIMERAFAPPRTGRKA